MGITLASPWTLWSPQVQPAASGRRPQRRQRHLRTAQAGALIRRLGLVGPPEVATLNRRGSPWVGNDPESPKSGALIRRLGLGIDPKQAPGIRRLGQENGPKFRRDEFVALGLTLNNFFSHLNYYISMPMEKKGQYVRLSAISQVGRTCSAPGLVTRGQRECQGPVWSPGGQLPYEYIKKKQKKKDLHVSGR